jgi:hypothetical protein
VAGLLALFLALFGNAVAHSVLVAGQERLDGLTAELEQEQARNQRLHLRAAALESPERIVEAAKDLGMVPAEKTEWLNPNDSSGSVTAEREVPGGHAEELATGAAGDGTDTAGR